MRWKSHVRFGERPGETDQEQSRHRAPGRLYCRRPAAQSDYEHSRPHDQGGITCLCEAGPVCRHNHRNKQQPGWKLRAASNRGWFKWTTPSGRTYLNGPTQYPT
jgi:hypothetical protein